MLAGLASAQTPAVHFVLLGDRTGEAQPGVYQEVWKEAAEGHPGFVVTAGDSIEGLNDASAEEQWRVFELAVEPYRRFPLYLTPGNHDIWSELSARLYEQHAGHPPHYSFDRGPVHVTVLDNSRTEDLPVSELAFLEQDLEAHAAQPVKFIISHRPSWIFKTVVGDSDFALHRIARKYGVKYVIAGHVHELLHYTVEGVEYVSLPSAGGHLRASKKYEDGWFFGYTDVEAGTAGVSFTIHELHGRTTKLSDWGPAGLAVTQAGERVPADPRRSR